MPKDALKTLIRLAKWDLDERRRELAELFKIEDRIKAEKEELLAEKSAQDKIVNSFPELAFTYGDYIKKFMLRREVLDNSLSEIAVAIEKARQMLEDAFMTLKTYEISDKNKMASIQKAEDLKQQKALDEMGLNSYRLHIKPADDA